MPIDIDKLTHSELIDLNNRRIGEIQTRHRRETLCRKLAQCMQRLTISKNELEQLPDTYTLAVQSGDFVPEHKQDASVNYLPPGLLDRPNEWVEIDVYFPNMHEDIMDRFISLHARSFMGRSHYRIFYRCPEGRKQVVDYLETLKNSEIDWKYAASSRNTATIESRSPSWRFSSISAIGAIWPRTATVTPRGGAGSF